MVKLESVIKIDGNKENVTLVIRDDNSCEGFVKIHIYNKSESFKKVYLVECTLFNGAEDNYCYVLTATDLIDFIKGDFSYTDESY